MDEQNNNPMDPGGTTGTDNSFGANEAQNTYGMNEAQNPYGTNNASNPYGTNGTQNPYGSSVTQNPYGSNGAANTYGMSGTQNPYGSNGAANSYGMNGAENPYGMGGAQNPYGTNGTQNPYGMGSAQNPYGAPGAQNPYGAAGMQNPYGAAGQSPYGRVEPPKPPKKKMSKKAKIFLFGGIGLAVLAAVAIVLCIMVFFPAMNKKAVKQGLENMLSADGMVSNSILVKELGADELATNFNNEGGELKADIKIGNDMYEGYLEAEADLAIDKASKQMSGDISVEVMKENMLDVEVFADAEQTYVTVADLLNGYLAVNNKNFISGLKNSWLLADLPDNAKSALSVIPDFDLDFFSVAAPLSLDRLTSDDNKLWKNSKISSEGSEDLYAGSESISAKKYKVTIPKETIQEVVGELVDTTINNMSGAGIDSLLGQAGISSSNISQYVSQAKTLISSMFKDDVVYYVYIKDEKVVSIKSSIDLNLMAYTIAAELDFTCFSTDTQSILNLSASVGVMGQKIEFKANCITKTEGDNLKTSATISASSMGTDMISGYYDQTYSKSSHDLTGSGSLTIKDKNAGSISINGNVSEIEKGKLVKLHIDELAIISASGVKNVKASGDITIKTKSAGIELKSRDTNKPVANLCTGTQDDAKAVFDKESEGYKKFMERFNKLLGGKVVDLDDF